jgi:chromosome transmission fidelity protein 18
VAFSKLNTSGSSSANVPVRYAVRSVLDQEFRKETTRKQFDARNAVTAKSVLGKSPKQDVKAIKAGLVKRDFFGRVIQDPVRETKDTEGPNPSDETAKAGRKVWVTYHEGFSNAVRKPISLGELMAGL